MNSEAMGVGLRQQYGNTPPGYSNVQLRLKTIALQPVLTQEPPETQLQRPSRAPVVPN